MESDVIDRQLMLRRKQRKTDVTRVFEVIYFRYHSSFWQYAMSNTVSGEQDMQRTNLNKEDRPRRHQERAPLDTLHTNQTLADHWSVS